MCTLTHVRCAGTPSVEVWLCAHDAINRFSHFFRLSVSVSFSCNYNDVVAVGIVEMDCFRVQIINERNECENSK